MPVPSLLRNARGYLGASALSILAFAFPIQAVAAETDSTSADAVIAAAQPVPATQSVVLSVRSAYESAWQQRSSGNFAGAVSTSDSALAEIGRQLSANPDASTRRELVELQSRIQGVRELAIADRKTAPPVEPGNVADAKVLAAPAIEDIEPQVNAAVYRYIQYFTGNGRSVFEKWLKRSGRYVELFRSVLKKEGLPPDLVHLVFVESGFNVNARSVSAAVGPWQFLRSTGKLFGLNINQWVDERKDPEKSTVAAARYLKHLYSIFGDWPLALASYNAGEGTVLRAIKAQGTTNYWDLKLPRQTEDYVPQFMAVLAISRDPAKYGFDNLTLEEPMEFDQVAFKGPVDLRVIAKLCECSYDQLKLLNPAVLRHAASGTNGVTVLRVPNGKGPVLLEALSKGVELPAVDLSVKHKVRRGESLTSIANQYHVSAEALARANGVGRKHPLRRGMTLTVPARLTTASKPTLIDGSDPKFSTAFVPARDLITPNSLNANSVADGRVIHVVHKGETLGSIAEKYSVSGEDIRRWNHLKTSTLKRGLRLKIRTGADPAIEAAAAASDSAKVASLKAPKSRSGSRRTHSASSSTVVVRSGDTLGSIAARHGVSLTALKRANGLRSSTIHVGQRLRLPA